MLHMCWYNDVLYVVIVMVVGERGKGMKKEEEEGARVI